MQQSRKRYALQTFMATLIWEKNEKGQPADSASCPLAGETRFEHATYGFGDRYSTVEPLPYALPII